MLRQQVHPHPCEFDERHGGVSEHRGGPAEPYERHACRYDAE
jgi:hypothetical protein